MMKTALIILNYNNFSDTRTCIESIRRFNTAPVKIIVVDNGSAEAERAMLRTYVSDCMNCGCDCMMVECAENSGYAKGNNAGLEAAYACEDVARVMILNNDIILVEDILPQLAAAQDAIDDCAVMSPVLYKLGLDEIDSNCARERKTVGGIIKGNLLHYFKRLFHGGNSAIRLPASGVMRIGVPSGACLLLKKDFMRRLGGFDPATFLYFEEDILAEKARRLGMGCYLALSLKCVHVGASTTARVPMTYKRMKLLLQSQRHYVKHYSGAGAVMRALHWLSMRAFLMMFFLQKSLGVRLKR